MFEDDDETNENFEETLRSIAHELGESVHRTMSQFDVDEIADAIGVDADRAREWVDTAAAWLSRRVENFGEDFTVPAAWRPTPRPANDPPATDPLRGAARHPLDMPTEEQGLALAALESGRWTVEPGTETLAAHGEGPGPSDALGLVRELRGRDWIAADGKLTTVGRRALDRWVESATKR
jgi:hypothetical protein